MFWFLSKFVPVEELRQLVFRYLWAKRKYGRDTNLRNDIASSDQIDIVIPAIDKDAAVLGTTVSQLRKHLQHPVGKIFIVSPSKSTAIRAFCKKNSCEFVDEATVTPIQKSEIDYKPDRLDRSGWILQQLIKLSADTISDSPLILVFDADTSLVRPHVFYRGGKTIFDHSDEFHQPYFDMYQKLVGRRATYPLSYIAHHMLVQPNVLKELREYLEKKHQMKWYEAILQALDPNEISSFSEYELYGNFYSSVLHRPRRHEYWYNRSFKASQIGKINSLEEKYSLEFKSLSFHTYIVDREKEE